MWSLSRVSVSVVHLTWRQYEVFPSACSGRKYFFTWDDPVNIVISPCNRLLEAVTAVKRVGYTLQFSYIYWLSNTHAHRAVGISISNGTICSIYHCCFLTRRTTLSRQQRILARRRWCSSAWPTKAGWRAFSVLSWSFSASVQRPEDHSLPPGTNVHRSSKRAETPSLWNEAITIRNMWMQEVQWFPWQRPLGCFNGKFNIWSIFFIAHFKVPLKYEGW